MLKKKIAFKLRNLIKKILILFIRFHFFLMLLVLFLSALLTFINPPVSTLMLYRKYIKNVKVKPVLFVETENFPSFLKPMILAAEDHRYYLHNGIDVRSIYEAIERNIRAKRVVFGASTLTQQFSRTFFLTPHRNILRKYIEAYVSVFVDIFMLKERVLELYVNYAEWGEGVFGIENAAHYYYGKTISELSYDECARIVTILASPILYDPNTIEEHPILLGRYEKISSLKDTILQQ